MQLSNVQSDYVPSGAQAKHVLFCACKSVQDYFLCRILIIFYVLSFQVLICVLVFVAATRRNCWRALPSNAEVN